MRFRSYLGVGILVAAAALAPLPYRGSGHVSEPGDPGCWTDSWSGMAPGAFALEEALRDRPPTFAYTSDQESTCI